MRTVIVNCQAARYVKCSCCGSNTRTAERYLQVFVQGKRGWKKAERYCVHCERYARMNNEGADAEIYRNEPPSLDTDNDGDGESGLRLREEYAAYQAAGCTSEFWSDRDAGFIRD